MFVMDADVFCFLLFGKMYFVWCTGDFCFKVFLVELSLSKIFWSFILGGFYIFLNLK